MALCAGYELGVWREDKLVDEVFAWLPSFVLPWSEQQTTLADATAVDLLRLAAHRVYESDHYHRRGEFGELILHGVLMQEFGTQAAVSKLWFKDASNDTVKGYDVVHVSAANGEELHLWLGEAKFYSRLDDAARAAVESFEEHLDRQYLRSEFALVAPKVDNSAPYAARLLEQLDGNTPLDEIFDSLHLPVLLTYDSAALAAHDCHSDSYRNAVTAEVTKAWKTIGERARAVPAVVEVICIPLMSKAELVQKLHQKLQVWQSL
jgi:hypothetical protein